MTEFSHDFLRQALPNPGEAMREWRDSGKGAEKGLIFRVTEKGDRRWSVRYVNDAGEHRRKAIGSFPSVGLAKARTEARKVKGLVAEKVDIVGKQNATKSEARRDKFNSLGGLAEAYWVACELGTHVAGDARPKRARTIKHEKRVYEKHIKPEFGNKPVASLRRAVIQDFIDQESMRKKSIGRLVRDVLRQLLSYAVRQSIIEYNPAFGVGAAQTTPRDRVLNDAEVKLIWDVFSPTRTMRDDDIDAWVTPEMALACRMAMVTVTRGGETVGMRFSEIDRKARIWTIPAERMKGKRTHIVPLSDLALSIIDEAAERFGGEIYVFPTPGVRKVKHEEACMDRQGLTDAMHRVVVALKIERATAHDFRRTASTNMTGERIGIPRSIVAQVLAHSEGGVTAKHYDKNDYLAEKRKALDAWARLLTTIVNDEGQPSNVVPLRKAS